MEPREILKTVAHTAPWFLTLRRAEPDKLLSALNTLKRRTDFHATSTELATGLASRNALSRTCYVHSRPAAPVRCASGHWKPSSRASVHPSSLPTLRLSEYGGSIDKARQQRHRPVGEPRPSSCSASDGEVVALQLGEMQCTPVPERGAEMRPGSSSCA